LAIILGIKKYLPQLRGETHSRRGELSAVERALIATLLAAEVQRHRDIAHQQKISLCFASQLDERILAGKRVEITGRNDGIRDAVVAGYGDELRLRMKRIVHMHVRHDLIAELDEIIGHFFRRDFRESKLRLRVDQSRVHGHPANVNQARVLGDFHGSRRADCCNFSVFDDEHAVFDCAVSHGKELAAAQSYRLLLSSHGYT